MDIAQSDKILAKLEGFGLLRDEEFTPAIVAVYVSAMDKPGLSLGRYINHFDNIKSKVEARFAELLVAGARDDVGGRLAALKYVIVDEYGYQCSGDDSGDLENVDIIRVVDRREGLSISLGLIYLYVGSGLGWDIKALNFPSHFLLRIEKEGERVIFDPFDICRKLEACDLRVFLKEDIGESAELSSNYYDPISNRDVVLRMLNNSKFRLIDLEDYKNALNYAEYMLLIAPDDYRPLLDAAVLYVKTGDNDCAIPLLEKYIDDVSDCNDRHDALMLLEQIRDS